MLSWRQDSEEIFQARYWIGLKTAGPYRFPLLFSFFFFYYFLNKCKNELMYYLAVLDLRCQGNPSHVTWVLTKRGVQRYY